MASILNVDQINNAAGTSAVTIDPSTGKPSFPNGVTLPAGAGGKVLQVVSAVSTGSLNTTSTLFADMPGMSATITPNSSSSKIFLVYDWHVYLTEASSGDAWLTAPHRLLRDTTVLKDTTTYGTGVNFYTASERMMLQQSYTYFDSPSTTSAVTYKTQGKVNSSSFQTIFNDPGYAAGGTITLMEIAQ